MKRLAAIACCLGLLLVTAACGDDDGGTVKEEGAASGSGSGSGSGSASAAAGSGSASAPADAECNPVGTELEGEATETVEVELKDFEFDPATIEVPADVITFEAVNNGAENHELAFLPGGGEVPFTDGVPDEEALGEAGAFELEAFPPGDTCNATYDLEPGTYTLFCIVESPDGETHYEKGMKGQLTVT